jgi:hypothetical protein
VPDLLFKGTDPYPHPDPYQNFTIQNTARALLYLPDPHPCHTDPIPCSSSGTTGYEKKIRREEVFTCVRYIEFR